MERGLITKVLLIFILLLLSQDVFSHENYDGNNAWITVLEDTCIYDNGNHAAFTSLENWHGHLLVAFREAGFHRATPTDKGKLRVLEKTNHGWKPQHTFTVEGRDLRDPYMLKWNDRLLLYTYDLYSELTDKGWTELKHIKHDAPYKPSIWKMRIHNNVAYGVGNAGGKWPLLLRSDDGVKWHVINEFKLGGDATEADMVFIGDSMYVCIRIDTPIGSNSLWGKSVYPFSSFQWTVMDVSVASPEMIVHSDSTILLSGREYDYHRQDGKDSIYVSLFALSRDGKIKKRYIVSKNGYDMGYASFYKSKSNQYFMSYYTGTQKTMIKLLNFIINDK